MKKYRGGGLFFPGSEQTKAIKAAVGFVKEIRPHAERYKDISPFNDLKEGVRRVSLDRYDRMLDTIFSTHFRYQDKFPKDFDVNTLSPFREKIKQAIIDDDEERRQQDIRERAAQQLRNPIVQPINYAQLQTVTTVPPSAHKSDNDMFFYSGWGSYN